MQWTWKGSVEDTNMTKTQCWLSRRLQPENTGVMRHIHERPVWGRGYVYVPPGTTPHSSCVMEETWLRGPGGIKNGAVEWSFQEAQGTQWRSGEGGSLVGC